MVVVVEKQLLFTHRNPAMAASNCIIEAAIVSQCLSRGIKFQSFPPVRAQRYFELGPGKEKKRHAIAKVKHILDNNEVKVLPELKDKFLASKKQDDFADCFLQAYLIFKEE
jgi:hypothetical protein